YVWPLRAAPTCGAVGALRSRPDHSIRRATAVARGTPGDAVQWRGACGAPRPPSEQARMVTSTDPSRHPYRDPAVVAAAPRVRPQARPARPAGPGPAGPGPAGPGVIGPVLTGTVLTGTGV